MPGLNYDLAGALGDPEWESADRTRMFARAREVTWRKSSRSGGESNACVEVAQGAEVVRVRDSKDPDGPVLSFGAEPWREFVAGVNAGEFDH